MITRFWRSAAMRWILLLTVLFLTLLDFYGLSLLPLGPVDYERFGNLGSWFQGFLTIAVVAIAALTLRSERQKQLAALEQREQQARDAHRADAGRVYGWLDQKVDPGRGTPRAVRAVFVNDTTIPVYEWILEVEGHEEMKLSHADHGPLLPGTRYVDPDSASWRRLAGSSLPRTRIEFTASTGERLGRSFLGQLEVLATPAELV